ncbi:MAG: Cupin 2 conserved barrel domain protein [Conexibacter sp.]|nr:Cupin 2 conserved barrel domain protein [Conexibacter sp.]
MSITTGDGYSVANLSDLGEGPGFRKIRAELDVTAFGINAIVLPQGYESNRHFHDRQQELYFVHRGRIEIRFGDGTAHVLEEGGIARVDAATVRSLKNVGDRDATYVCIGGADGYVGRDGQMVSDGDAGAA